MITRKSHKRVWKRLGHPYMYDLFITCIISTDDPLPQTKG